MEGRLALTLTAQELEKQTGIKCSANDISKYYAEPKFNLAPSSFLPAITHHDQNVLRFLKWGLIPGWTSSKTSKGLSSISAPSFKEKPAFQKALLSKRCLILANGFFKWKDTPAGKIPYFLTLKSKKTFAIIGLWESWEEEDALTTCCLITKKPSSTLSYFHSDIPLSLPIDSVATWLKENSLVEELLKEDHFLPESEFEYYPVNRKVLKGLDNNPKYIEKIAYRVAEQTSLF